MCNLYSMTSAVEAMRNMFNVDPADDHMGNAEPLEAIYPKYPAPVVRLNDADDRELTNLSWGFRRSKKSAKTGNFNAPQAVNNARADKVETSFFWRFSFAERRCLVPATSFCEWPPGGNPQVFHWFALRGDEPRPPFAFAGMWQNSRYDTKDGPETCENHTIITTNANDLVATVHPDRMPVILRPEDYEQWLFGSVSDAVALLKPYPAELMQVVRRGEGERSDPVDATI